MAYTQDSTATVAEFNQFYYDAWRVMGPYSSEAYRDLRAYAGDNWTNAERQKLIQQKRMVLELNKIRRVVNLYTGYERENRLSTIVSPVEDGDEITADQQSDVLLQVYDKCDANYTISEAFEHMLKTGMSIIGVYMDYTHDKVNGDVKLFWKPWNAVILDPYFSKRDLSDCGRAATRDLFSREEVKALLPFIDPAVIDGLPTGLRDNKFQYLGIYTQYNSTYIAKNLLTYDQYWKRVNVPTTYIVDIETGEQQEFKGSKEEEKNLQEVIANSPNLELIKTTKSTVELNIMAGGQLLYKGPDPTGLDTFPFVLTLGYFEPLIDSYELKIQGVVRSIRDAQRQYNRRHSQIIDIMESIVNTGWIHINGSVLDPKMLLQAGAGRNIVLNEDATLDSLREISPPQVPPGYLQYQDIMDQNILEIPGGNDEILGISRTGDSQVSGTLAHQRASNGLKGNRSLFDNFERTKKQLGEIVLETVQRQYTPGKVTRLIGQEPTPDFFDLNTSRYKVTVQQEILTQTQREAYYKQLLELRALEVPIPDDELIRAAPLQGKTKLLEIMQKQREQQEIAQMQEEQDAHIQRQLALSQKEENVALAQERRARVLSDIGLARERIAEAEQNYAKAFLDNVSAVSEMEDMDRRRMIDVVKIATDMYKIKSAEAEQTLQSDLAKAGDLEASGDLPLPQGNSPQPQG